MSLALASSGPTLCFFYCSTTTTTPGPILHTHTHNGQWSSERRNCVCDACATLCDAQFTTQAQQRVELMRRSRTHARTLERLTTSHTNFAYYASTSPPRSSTSPVSDGVWPKQLVSERAMLFSLSSYMQCTYSSTRLDMNCSAPRTEMCTASECLTSQTTTTAIISPLAKNILTCERGGSRGKEWTNEGMKKNRKAEPSRKPSADQWTTRRGVLVPVCVATTFDAPYQNYTWCVIKTDLLLSTRRHLRTMAGTSPLIEILLFAIAIVLFNLLHQRQLPHNNATVN